MLPLDGSETVVYIDLMLQVGAVGTLYTLEDERITMGRQLYLEECTARSESTEWRTIRIVATVCGKLVSDEVEELEPVDVLLPVIVRVGAVIVCRPAIC